MGLLLITAKYKFSKIPFCLSLRKINKYIYYNADTELFFFFLSKPPTYFLSYWCWFRYYLLYDISLETFASEKPNFYCTWDTWIWNCFIYFRISCCLKHAKHIFLDLPQIVTMEILCELLKNYYKYLFARSKFQNINIYACTQMTI